MVVNPLPSKRSFRVAVVLLEDEKSSAQRRAACRGESAGIGSRQTCQPHRRTDHAAQHARTAVPRESTYRWFSIPGGTWATDGRLGAAKLTAKRVPFATAYLRWRMTRCCVESSEGENAGERAYLKAKGREFGVARLLYEQTGDGRRSIGYLGTMTRYADGNAVVHGIDGHWLQEWRLARRLPTGGQRC